MVARRLAILALVGVNACGKSVARPTPPADPAVLRTAFYPLALTYQKYLVDSNETQGGAIAALEHGFLLVTGEGEFFRLEWTAHRDSLVSTRLALQPPFDRAGFLADSESIRSKTGLRVTDVALDTAGGATRIYLVHQFWNPADRCLALRVSRTAMPPAEAASAQWETLFETRPCLPLSPAMDDLQSGGELEWDRDGTLLLATGDHGFNGTTEAALAQQADNDYGKVLRLDLRGGGRILSVGHRSPQGLLVDREGRRWDTEHGPQGGDEINLLRDGRNYGWPLVSYGTQYGVPYWPPARGKRDHGSFEEPVQAFVPSVAIASLIQLGERQFPDWDGDLLAASLRAMTLYRIRERAGHVSYIEPIPLGRRIRDLVEADDGRLVLWTDEGDLVIIGVASTRRDGRQIYARCGGCHGESLEGTGLAPSLRDVYGNRVASRAGFNYSPALRDLGGLWTRPRLERFFADPAKFAPGNRMEFEGIKDRAERMELIEYLRTQR